MKGYNKLFKGGKPIGKAFIGGFKKKNESLSAFKMRIQKTNQSWNKKVGKGYQVKLVKIGKKY